MLLVRLETLSDAFGTDVLLSFISRSAIAFAASLISVFMFMISSRVLSGTSGKISESETLPEQGRFELLEHAWFELLEHGSFELLEHGWSELLEHGWFELPGSDEEILDRGLKTEGKKSSSSSDDSKSLLLFCFDSPVFDLL